MDTEVAAEWRKLGFYYDYDDRLSVNQWRFYGSRQGLLRLADLVVHYSQHPANTTLTADAHYGPYSYLKLITLDHPVITGYHIGGLPNDFRVLGAFIIDQVARAKPGNVFRLDTAYGQANTATASCFIMADTFDPASLDELIQSDRQTAVNRGWQQ